MYYFAYGSNMFTYRLEKRVGKVNVVGIARLIRHQFACNKLSVDGSLKADAFYTGNEQDFVLGIVFDINPAAKPILDKEEGLGKGYDMKNVSVEMVGSGKELDMFTYVTHKPISGIENAPYQWYMDLIIAGADGHQLDEGYIQQLRVIRTKPDELPWRESVNQFILKESLLPRKNLSRTLELIEDLFRPREFTIDVNDHILNDRVLYYKGDNNFGFETTSPVEKGVDTHKELDLADKILSLESGGQKWVVKGRDFLINTTNFDSENLVKILTGTLNAFSTGKQIESGRKWYRFLMPMERELMNLRDYQASGYVENFKLQLGGLVEINIDDKKYHFYCYFKSKKPYAVIDCLSEVDLEYFKRACHCILLTSTFVSGTEIAGHSYFAAFDTADMEFPLGLHYHAFGDREENQMAVFTTNPFIGIKSSEMERDENGALSDEQLKKLKEGMIYFPQQVFSNICNLTFTNDKLLRALLLWAINQSASLELKLGVQYILLETLAGVIVTDGNADLKPIKDAEIATELIAQMTKLLNKFCTDNKIEQNDITAIYKKIENLNAPPNMDKLGKAFSQVKYELSEEQKQILKQRNTFLHGSIPSLGDVNVDFKNLFHLSLRLHFLTALLILKYAGFEGKIINYAKIHEGITGKFLDEERLVKI